MPIIAGPVVWAAVICVWAGSIVVTIVRRAVPVSVSVGAAVGAVSSCCKRTRCQAESQPGTPSAAPPVPCLCGRGRGCGEPGYRKDDCCLSHGCIPFDSSHAITPAGFFGFEGGEILGSGSLPEVARANRGFRTHKP